MNTELIGSTDLLEVIFENTHTLIAYLDKDLNFLRVNKAYAFADKKQPEYFIGKNHFDLFPNEENQAIFRRASETGEPYFCYAKPFEYEYNSDRGVTHWDWSLVPVKDKSDNVISLILHLINVSERIKAEEKLKIEERLSYSFIESATALMIILDNTGRIARFNRACETVSQYRSIEVIGKFVWDILLTKKDIEPVKTVFQDLTQQALSSDFTNNWLAKDGSLRLIHWSNNVLKNDNNEVQFIISVGNDVTQQREIETALKESEHLLKEAQHIARMGYLDWSPQTNEINWSEETYHIYGFPLDFKPTLQSTIKLVHPDDKEKVNAALNAAIDEKQNYNIEYRVIRPDKKIIYVHAKGEFILNKQDEVKRMLCTIIDITTRKKDQIELDKYRYHLEELVAERTQKLKNTQEELVRKERLATLGQLTGTVSHELRNPLSAMRPSLYIIQKMSDKNNEHLQQAIQRVDRSIMRCDRIIDELLNFTRSTQLNEHITIIDEWLDSVIDEVTIPKNIKVEKDFLLKNVVLTIDDERLRRAVINILDNACHAMLDNNQSDKIGLPPRLRIKSRGNRNRIEIIVSDTGDGIPKTILEKIYEPLFSTKGFGIGLGMPIVKQIMEQHHGGVDIKSEENKGTSVTLWLPVSKNKDSDEVLEV